MPSVAAQQEVAPSARCCARVVLVQGGGWRVYYCWVRSDQYPENFYHDCWYECGFRELSGPSQPGDMVIMQVQANKWNHAGILLDGNMLLHHLYGHLSQRVPYGGYWQERTIKIVRYESILDGRR